MKMIENEPEYNQAAGYAQEPRNKVFHIASGEL